jgi:hypothetical protein
MPGPVIGHFFCLACYGLIASRLTPTGDAFQNVGVSLLAMAIK